MIKSRLGHRLVGALKVTAIVLCLTGFVVGMPVIAKRAQDQENSAKWRDLAVAYLQAGNDAHADSAESLDMAAVRVVSDEIAGVGVELRGLEDLHAFDASHLRLAEDAGRERECLSQAIYYEARSEGYAGQVAVAEVILNRVRHRAYPDTICGVVYQGSERSTGCQFTFTCDGSLAILPRGRAWARSELVAEHVLMGFAPTMTQSATHYHTTAVNPRWAPSLVRTRQIGTHVFYRFPNRAEREVLREREA